MGNLGWKTPWITQIVTGNASFKIAIGIPEESKYGWVWVRVRIRPKKLPVCGGVPECGRPTAESFMALLPGDDQAMCSFKNFIFLPLDYFFMLL